MGDYEKKYKEALELARVAAFNGHQSLMEGIFPELAESEDEKTRKRITALVNAHGQGMYKDDMLTWLENIPYTIDHEKREGFHLGYKAGLEKQGEKKPQRMISAEAKEAMYDKPACAWSEEDEEHIHSLLDRLEGMCKKGSTFITTKFAVNQDMDWLKSLKERYTWKPSDEQMKFLQKCIEAYNEVTFPTEVRVLSSLYNDLKKLKGE